MSRSDPSLLPRRRFVQGLAAGAAVASAGILVPARATPAHPAAPASRHGREFDLTIGEHGVNLTGRARTATLVDGMLPAPTLRWREGDEVTVRVHNRLHEPTSIHWHGILLPFVMDGVPGLSFPGIAPGDTFTYRFRVRQSGTYWYHSHSGFQEQTGLYGALVIDPAQPDPVHADREHVLVLSDWSDESPRRIFDRLRKKSHYYNRNERTLPDLVRDLRTRGLAATWRERWMWNRMRMSATDISDVTGATYTFLVNGQPPAANWTGLFRPGERVRLRVINASAMTFFDLRIPGLAMTVVAADGQPVEPVDVDEFRIGVAETYDVIVTPGEDRAYTVFAQAIDRSGYARATLAPRPGMRAPVPALDPPPVLGHRDMGMAHAGGRGVHGGHEPESDHQHDMAEGHGGHAASDGRGLFEHLPSEYGPGVDMRAERARPMLDDPGIGLRDNGRRVLTYADLATRGGPPDTLHADRELTLHLTGHMRRYVWSFDGRTFADAPPLRLVHGERVRINLVNDTMMHHPIHLHGMWSDLETGPGRLARKHTVTVKPGEVISYLVRADAPGPWAYHCHLLYHMEAGMFRTVLVEHPPHHGTGHGSSAHGHDRPATGDHHAPSSRHGGRQ